MKVNRILFIIIFILVLFPAISFISWLSKPNQQLDILVIDKTVSNKSFKEHKSFFWILNHNRIVNAENNRYSHKKDYFGFFPLKNSKDKEYYIKSIRLTAVDSLADKYDAMYITDARGVFFSDWYKSMESENSTLIYGGFNQNDYYLVQKMKELGKLIIAEYDLLGHPTNPLIRYKTQDLFDFSLTGWSGKYFKSLDEESGTVPSWIIKKYKDTHKKVWPFSDAGVILLSNSNVIVLENKIHLNSKTPTIKTNDVYKDLYQLPDETPFTGWFKIITSSERNHEIASLNIDVNNLGKKILSNKDIPSSFPIVLEQKDNYQFFYFAGDFADNYIPYFTYPFNNLNKVQKIFYSKDADDSNVFFWEFYHPLMKNIIKNYIADHKK